MIITFTTHRNNLEMMSTHTYKCDCKILQIDPLQEINQLSKQIQFMSKRRNSSSQIPRFIKNHKYTYQNPESTLNSTKYRNSCLFTNNLNKKIKTQGYEDAQDTLSTVFNKNISKFRDIVSLNDNTLLPFISSLRTTSLKRKHNFSNTIKTKIQAFSVSDKLTCNQTIQKDNCDIKGRTKRLSNAFYRWHNKSGPGIKQSCLFETKLRQTSQQFYKSTVFKNMFKKVQNPKDIIRRYTEDEMICPKQRRLFALQN